MGRHPNPTFGFSGRVAPVPSKKPTSTTAIDIPELKANGRDFLPQVGIPSPQRGADNTATVASFLAPTSQGSQDPTKTGGWLGDVRETWRREAARRQTEIDDARAAEDQLERDRVKAKGEALTEANIDLQGLVDAHQETIDDLTAAANDNITNPVRQAGNIDYSAAIDLPTTLEDARKAKIWLNSAESVPGIYLGDDGKYYDANETQPADSKGWSPTVVANGQFIVEHRDDLRRQIILLYEQDAEYEAKAGFQTIDLASAAELSQLNLDFDRAILAEEARLDEIRAGATQTRDIELLTIEQKDRIATLDKEQVDKIATLEFEHENAIAILQEKSLEERFTFELKRDLDMSIIEAQGDIDAQIQNALLTTQSEQNNLDRALRALELDEANRASQVLEQIRGREIALQERQFKLGIFQTLAQSPELLYFLGQQPGTIAEFGDLLGDDGTQIEAVIAQINAKPTLNIQQFARLRGEDQQREMFRITGQTGERNVAGRLIGQAPTVAISRTVDRSRIGRPDASDRARLGRS